MPYTPPSHRSPASSAPNSPDVSRRSSIASASGQRPALPRSASYLSKHRRTSSAVSINDANSAPSPPYGNSDDEPNKPDTPALSIVSKKSSSPVPDDRVIPNAAIISPPDSASSGSEDEGHPEIRGRKLGKLREAVSQIPQPRTPSPSRQMPSSGDGDLTPTTIMRTSFSTTSLSDLAKSSRKMGHVRSATDPDASLLASNSTVVSDESEEDTKKPIMVRKKSGELVRPALRPAHRRPSSMPGTPVFAKVVHFDSHLEHVRHFLQVDRPLAVSAGSSPVDNYDSDTEYPFSMGGEKSSVQRSPPFEWELVTNNFPHDSASRKTLPVRLEKVWLSVDQKSMLGSIAVSNLAFHKSVICRFTLDYWKTTSEVIAEYSHEIRSRDHSGVSQDRFQFSIKLSDTTNLESKKLFFCIRYTVSGQEFWDNNNGANFQVDFKRKHKAQNGKNNFQGAASRPVNSLPRSNRRQSPSAAPRPAPIPPHFDEFGNKEKFKFDEKSIHSYIGESGAPGGLRFKTKSTGNLASDTFTKDMSCPSGAAFANRYDFGASLNAAVQAAKDTGANDKDTLYMKRNVRSTSPTSDVTVNNTAPAHGAGPVIAPSPSIGLASSSYEELVKKYCFFGSKQSNSTAKTGGPAQDGGFDGSKADIEPSMLSSVGDHHRRTGLAMHHSFHLRNLSSQVPVGTIPNIPLTVPVKTLSSPVPGSHAKDLSSPMTINNARPRSPSVTMAGTSPNDRRFHLPQQVRADRFSWHGEPHATAIRG